MGLHLEMSARCTGLLLLAAMAGTPSIAQDAKGASAPSAERRELVIGASSNVYAAGQTTRTNEAIEGDFVGAGARVIVDRPVKSDALLAGGSVDVRAAVGDDVRAVGGDVRIESSVGGELFAAGGSITLAQGSQVDQGGMLFAGTANIDGKVVGPLKVRAQKIVINGEVTGDVDLVGEQIDLGPTARIGGNLVYAARSFNRADGATIGGTTRQDTRSADRGRGDSGDRERERRWGDGPRSAGASWFTCVLSYLGLLACAAVFLLLFPRFAEQAPEQISRMPWSSLGIGFGAVLGVPVLAVLLFITLLGIPLGIALLALFPGLLLLGYVVGLLFLAWRLRVALHKPAGMRFGGSMAIVAATLLLVMLIGRLPFIGGLLHFLLVIAGVGACVLEWRRRRHAPPATAAPPAQPPASSPQSPLGELPG
jgi:cytoskeletal protein CcmA (bactofilin family)